MRVVGVPAHKARYVDEVAAAMSEFTDGGVLTPDDILAQIESRERQCWVIVDEAIAAVCLTRIMNDRKKVCEITHLTGKGLNEWSSAFVAIEEWALSMGCDRIRAIARPGYERLGKEYGLRKTHVVLEKDL